MGYFDKYFAVLGLKPNASTKDIKAAFRSKVKLYHPDRSGTQDTRERFMAVTEAYEILMQRDDLVRRARQLKREQQSKPNRPNHPNHPNHPKNPRASNGYRQAYAKRDNGEGSVHERARTYADMAYADFEKTAIYRTAVIVNFTFDYVFVAIGVLMITAPFVGYFLINDEVPGIEGEEIHFPFLPVILGVAFLFGLWQFIFKPKRLEHSKRNRELE